MENNSDTVLVHFGLSIAQLIDVVSKTFTKFHQPEKHRISFLKIDLWLCYYNVWMMRFQFYPFCYMYYIHYDHNSNHLKPTPGKRDKFEYTDHLSTEMKPQQERLDYFPKLNSVVKYRNTGSKYSKPSPKKQSRHSWSQPIYNGIFALQYLWSFKQGFYWLK